MTPALSTTGLQAGYQGLQVLRGVDVELPAGEITALIGPNGCGKSTLLKALGRQLEPDAGTVLLKGQDISTLRPRELARRLAFLPQEPSTPEGVTVRDVISYGRYPYTGAFASLSAEDNQAVEDAARQAGVDELLDARATDLSGGQRQRVWVAMAVAQHSDILLLDEPTTYLDPAHQIAVLDLVAGLKDSGRTIVMVLHDMTHAARFADYIVAMRDGGVVCAGPAAEVLTQQLVRDIFGIGSLQVTDPQTGRILPIPYR